jgi:uncharacterized protein YdaU (DUF1376 family)
MHYYAFNIRDYRADTAHLTNEEDLAYRRLIDLYYESEAMIPLDTQWVAKRLRLDFQTVQTVLKDMFQETPDGWFHARCDKEIQIYHANAEKNRANGAKGGRPKKQNNPTESENNPLGYSGFSEKTQGYPNANPNERQPITSNQKLETNNQDLNQELNKTAGALFVASPSADAPPSELVQKKKKVEFDAEQLALAEAMADDLKKINPNLAPNLEKWANDIRLLEQARKTSIEAIESLWKFANTHSFWQKVILSPSNLREKWDRLETERLSAKAGQARAAPVNKIAPIVPHYQRQEGFIKL